jgi:hypothetical protein
MKKPQSARLDGAGKHLLNEQQSANPNLEIKRSRNLWPWAIIATFVVFLSGTASLVVLACSQKVDLVSADYYDQEIRFQNHLDRLNNARDLQRAASIRFDAATHRLLIALPPEQSGKATNGQIQLYRPSTIGLDRRLPLAVNASGEQALDASNLRPGFWKVRLAWTCAGQDYFAEQGVLVGRAL